MTGSIDVNATEPEVPQSTAMVDEAPADGRCPTCDWDLAAFDHDSRHAWTLYWLSLRRTVEQ